YTYNPPDHAELWRWVSPLVGWTAVNGAQRPIFTQAHADDFIAAADGTLHVFAREDDGDLYVASRGPGSAQWVTTPTIVTPPAYYGIGRVATDAAGYLYLVTPALDDGRVHVRLRAYDANLGAWGAAQDLSGPGVTAMIPSVAAGSAGHVGVGWYEADGVFDPGAAPGTTVWRYVYAAYAGATGAPQLLGRSTVLADVAEGPLSNSGIGDFTSATVRPSSAEGWVALSFACSTSACGTSPSPMPVFAAQTSGPGLG
ncbi:MAG TPA: hypothetical protein VGR28_11400, partial [Candidatus Thermoplasmatota archaeon]|nr:hypothetical protein [Candidatus Thermoplasmatota archaeon]